MYFSFQVGEARSLERAFCLIQKQKRCKNGVEYRNSEGYADSTAYKALKNAEKEERAKEEKSFQSLKTVLTYVAKHAGFEFVFPPMLRSRKSGKTYR